MKKNPTFKLDKEEKELSDSFDMGEWVSIKNLKQEKIKAHIASENYQKKDARINIRISTTDLDQIKQKKT